MLNTIVMIMRPIESADDGHGLDGRFLIWYTAAIAACHETPTAPPVVHGRHVLFMDNSCANVLVSSSNCPVQIAVIMYSIDQRAVRIYSTKLLSSEDRLLELVIPRMKRVLNDWSRRASIAELRLLSLRRLLWRRVLEKLPHLLPWGACEMKSFLLFVWGILMVWLFLKMILKDVDNTSWVLSYY